MRTIMKITQSQLKIIAMITMLIDHTGVLLFPDIATLRIIGRVAFPIFAYLIAEGCVHTHNKAKYLLRVTLCACSFQIVQFMVDKSSNPCVVWAYAAAIVFAIIMDWAKTDWYKRELVPMLYGIIMSLVLLITNTDYLCFGFLLVISAYLLHDKKTKWIPITIILFIAGICMEHQLWCLMTIPLLMLYDGARGKLNLGYAVYYFYPLHFLFLGAIKYMINI